jgi:hypothetical protein
LETPYDLATMIVFAGLVVLFLQRSMAPPDQQDKMIWYLPPSLGCMGANQAGNYAWNNTDHQYLHAVAIIGIVAVLVYSWFVLKPFAKTS